MAVPDSAYKPKNWLIIETGAMRDLRAFLRRYVPNYSRSHLGRYIASLDDELTVTVMRTLRPAVVVRAATAAVGRITYLTTSPEIVQRLNTEIVKILQSPEVKERLFNQSVEVAMNPFLSFIRLLSDPTIAFLLLSAGSAGLIGSETVKHFAKEGQRIVGMCDPVGECGAALSARLPADPAR